jgi:5-formyltetrahydrofolate cyclo-ligase
MTSKEQIRAEHRLHRLARPAAAIESAGAGIAEHGLAWAAQATGGQSGTFAAYLGVGVEPPTLALITALHEDGHRVLLPVCEPERTLAWVHWTPASTFVLSRYAPVQEPDGERQPPAAVASAAGLFLPATAVDRSGNRIGQGGGYYDKFLASLEAAGVRLPTVAVIYDSELLPAGTIPDEPFDRPVPAVLTPSGVIQLMM